MAKLWWVRGYRVAFAALTLLAIVVQLARSTSTGFSPANFFSFFTIESNLIAAGVLLWGASGDAERRPSSSVDLIRGAAVLYMSITGVVYGVLLAGYQQELQTTIPWVDTVLHRVIPVVMVADWLIDPPRAAIEFRRALLWLVYPLLYAAYSLIRGPIVGWYPYPFLDPGHVGGYGAVALYGLGIAAGTLLFTWLVITIGGTLRLVAAKADDERRAVIS